MDDIVIVAAARTPVGSFLGSLKDVSAAFLGKVAIKEEEITIGENELF